MPGIRNTPFGISEDDYPETVGVSPLTIKKHLENIYATLGVSSRSAAVAQLLRTLGFETLPGSAATTGGQRP
jgi:hypothetical protein